MDIKKYNFTKAESGTIHFHLVCFHHCGGSGSYFIKWSKVLEGSGIALWGISLPGRNPMQSVQLGSFPEIIAEMVPRITSTLSKSFEDIGTKPIIFFGHSLGGILAFEAAREINSVGTVRVSHLIISAVNNPCLLTEVNRDPSSTRWFNASDEVLSAHLRTTGGLTVQLDPAYLTAILRVVKMDYKLFEHYSFDDSLGLDCPLRTMIGSEDTYVGVDSMDLWRERTTGAYEHATYSGGNHFYLMQDDLKESVLAKIVSACQSTSSVVA